MNSEISVFLPAGMKQFRNLKNKYILKNKKVLVIGAGSERICYKMIEYGAASVVTIVNEYESLISARLVLSKENNIIVKMMEYDNTDFKDNEFDLVYAQASVSTSNRNKIIKEIKRILITDGVLCVGEITVLKETYPAFVKDIFESSDILALQHNSCKEYYSDRKFEVLYEEDLSTSLRSFYETAAQTLREEINNLTENDKSYYKKLLNKISHESNAYLNLGADKYIGFKMLLLKI